MGSKGFPSKYRPDGTASTQYLRHRRIQNMGNSGVFNMASARREDLGIQKPFPKRRSALHDMIGRKLRHHYEDAQQHPLPSRLVVLLELLDELPEGAPASRRN